VCPGQSVPHALITQYYRNKSGGKILISAQALLFLQFRLEMSILPPDLFWCKICGCGIIWDFRTALGRLRHKTCSAEAEENSYPDPRAKNAYYFNHPLRRPACALCGFTVLEWKAMPVRLYVGNLPYDVTEPDLREFFLPVGPLSSVIIPVDRETGKRRGFAFVEFSDPAQAVEATRRFNNQPFKDRTIIINEARARESRPDSGLGARSGFPMRSGAGASRPGFSPGSSLGRPDFAPNPMGDGPAGRAERRSRNFGSDAKPSRKRKPQHGPKGEAGGKKGPIRERVGGQFFGGDDDVGHEEDLELESLPGLNNSDEDDGF
jgi:hypothetical protein